MYLTIKFLMIKKHLYIQRLFRFGKKKKNVWFEKYLNFSDSEPPERRRISKPS